jgi:DNA polymerase III subunit epsilon
VYTFLGDNNLKEVFMSNNHLVAKERAIEKAKEYLFSKPVYIDTETTGFKPDDEIVDISIIDYDGSVLYNSLIKPKKKIPIDATNIHHITNEMVTYAPSWFDAWFVINQKLSGRVLGIYNEEYDIRLMKQTTEKWGIDWNPAYKKSFCVMKLFADFYGEWDDYHGNYKWQKLEFAGKYFGIKIQNTHRALDDTLLTREVLKHIANSGGGNKSMKTCPFCAEEIKEAAIVCKHCKRDLPYYEMATIKNDENKLESASIVKKEIYPGELNGNLLKYKWIGDKLGILVEKFLGYFSFMGKANRTEFLIANIVLPIAILTLGTLFDSIFDVADFGISISLILVFWVSFASMVRRTRDCGKSPGILLFLFIPLGQFILLLYLLFQEGKEVVLSDKQVSPVIKEPIVLSNMDKKVKTPEEEALYMAKSKKETTIGLIVLAIFVIAGVLSLLN